MEIYIDELIEGAKKATGLVVVFDVFRAFTVAGFVLGNGAERIIPVESVDEAFRLKKEFPHAILMGERKGVKVDGFDYGNSPHELKNIDFSGKTVIMTTSAGTKGIVNARLADEILAGSFVNVSAIIDYIRKKNPGKVTLVAMGAGGCESRDEDLYCARYVKSSLEGHSLDFSEIVEHLKSYKSAGKFFDKNKPDFPEGDFWCAMDIDRFDFAMIASKKDNIEIKIVNPGE